MTTTKYTIKVRNKKGRITATMTFTDAEKAADQAARLNSRSIKFDFITMRKYNHE